MVVGAYKLISGVSGRGRLHAAHKLPLDCRALLRSNRLNKLTFLSFQGFNIT